MAEDPQKEQADAMESAELSAGLTRREALTKAGKLAWSAPILVTLFPSGSAKATDCAPGTPPLLCPPGPS